MYRYAVDSVVRNVIPVTTGLAQFPIGTQWRVRKRFRGYELEGLERCPHCGVRPRASRVEQFQLEPVPEVEKYSLPSGPEEGGAA